MAEEIVGSLSWDEAKEIMREKAIGIEDVIKKGLKIPRKMKAKYATVPFAENELKIAKEKGMYLVAMPEIDMLNLDNLTDIVTEGHRWYEGEKIGETKSKPGYQVMGEVSNSTQKSWTQQISMVPVGYEIPLLVEVAYLAVMVEPVKCFSQWLRCPDRDSGKNRLILGLGYRRLIVSSCDDLAKPHVGIAIRQHRTLV